MTAMPTSPETRSSLPKKASKSGVKPSRPRWASARWLAAIAAYVVACGALYLISFTWFQGTTVEASRAEATLHQRSLRGALERFQHLPPMLAQDPFVIAAAGGGDTDILNRRLAAFAASANLDAIYLMDMAGLTIAASNYDQPRTFLGQNYGFRPYFRAAAQGEIGEFFAIGATTSRPGYFVAAPVRAAATGTARGSVIGVVALKLDLQDVDNAWGDGGAVFVTNADGVVTLATSPEWLYRAATDITPDRAAVLRQSRQFADEPLSPLPITREGGEVVRLDGRLYVAVQVPVGRMGWVLHYLSDARAVRAKAAQTIFYASIALLIVATMALIMRAERVRRALRTSQADRRRLSAANLRLEREIAERRVAEQKLSTAQADLARVSRLAALGELAASVTHELGQPIAAMRTYLAAEEISGASSPLVMRLSSLVGRMEGVARQLRFFAAPGDAKFEPVALHNVAEAAIQIVAHDAVDVEIRLVAADEPVVVSGVQSRLEQVVINLLRNAILAVRDADLKNVVVTISQRDGWGVLTVEDTGPGLDGRSMEDLQEPFHTTRASGEGMGLGLAISAGIMREHQGKMYATDYLNENNVSGAQFVIETPLGQMEGSGW